MESNREEISQLRQKLREQVDAGKEPDSADLERLAALVEETGYTEELGEDID